MGILNVTPDSFVGSSRLGQVGGVLETAGRMLEEGARILDVGGASSRPGSVEVPADEERRRVLPAIEALHHRYPEALISVDTWRAAVAAEAVQAGAGLVNDISAGRMDADMLPCVAALKVPYILMHMQGTPRTMQHAPVYQNVVAEVVHYLSGRVLAARNAGIADVVVDPGFGFGKTTGHNYALLRGLPALKQLGVPVLAGLSRKRMINEVLGTTPEEALNGTTVLNTMALLNGAGILRVHDVRQAVQALELLRAYRSLQG
ncbi:MAG: dihydropteroate synthase [Flavobacteriales bacterium]|nr:dihydropteroate synthase [Flavobacteriales bacterium]MBP9079661.1 dihydropteroate synthase [Flavobacteriales bacterium]